MFRGLFFMLWVGAVVGLFTASNLFGYRMGSPTRERIPASVRSSPGGYRSYHFWHTGFSGGK
jgi:hypothetical protein